MQTMSITAVDLAYMPTATYGGERRRRRRRLLLGVSRRLLQGSGRHLRTRCLHLWRYTVVDDDHLLIIYEAWRQHSTALAARRFPNCDCAAAHVHIHGSKIIVPSSAGVPADGSAWVDFSVDGIVSVVNNLLAA